MPVILVARDRVVVAVVLVAVVVGVGVLVVIDEVRVRRRHLVFVTAELALQRGEVGVCRAVLEFASDLGLLRFGTAAPHSGSTPSHLSAGVAGAIGQCRETQATQWRGTRKSGRAAVSPRMAAEQAHPVAG